MKHIHFDVKSDGYYGAYWECRGGSDCTVIAMLGDDRWIIWRALR